MKAFALDKNDPEPDVPRDKIPMAQCAFEILVFKISAVHTSYRSWLRSSSTYEPSDPPIRLEFFFRIKIEKMGFVCWQHRSWCSLILAHMHRAYHITSLQPRTRHNCSAMLRNQRSRFRLWTRIRVEEPEAATPNGRCVASIDFMLD